MDFKHSFGLAWEWQGERMTVTHNVSSRRVAAKSYRGRPIVTGIWMGDDLHLRESDTADQDYVRRGFLDDLCSLLRTLSEYDSAKEQG